LIPTHFFIIRRNNTIYIFIQRKIYYLGSYNNEIDAAKSYNKTIELYDGNEILNMIGIIINFLTNYKCCHNYLRMDLYKIV
jgi:hypothetical protein